LNKEKKPEFPLGAKLDPPEVEEKKVYVRYVTPAEMPQIGAIVSEEAEKIRKMLELKKS
jgi:hypothetical protein